MKNVWTTVPTMLSHGENKITNPCEFANVFNNYFTSVADTGRQNIKYSYKHFSEYLKHQHNNSIFIQSTDSDKMANIISSLNIKQLEVLSLFEIKKNTYFWFADLFNLSFSSGSCPSILKTAKVGPVFENIL